MASGDQVFFSKINILSCVYEMSCYDELMTVLWFYIQQLLSLTTKNGQLNATSDAVDRQAGSHH